MRLEVMFFTVKLLGAVSIMVGCCGMGYLWCSGLNKRILALREFQRLVLKMSGDISCLAEPLPLVMRRAGMAGVRMYEPFFYEVARQMQNNENRTFACIWETCADKYLDTLALKKEDCILIKELGMMLGNHDRKMQVRVLDMFGQRLHQEILAVENAAGNQKKVFGGLWVFGGLFLVIVLL